MTGVYVCVCVWCTRGVCVHAHVYAVCVVVRVCIYVYVWCVCGFVCVHLCMFGVPVFWKEGSCNGEAEGMWTT